MSEYDTESYCCCSLRDRCLIFAAQILGLFAFYDVGIFMELVKINSPESQMPSQALVDITDVVIVIFVICTVLVIFTACCIAGILKKRRWMLLVFLIAFGIYDGLQFVVVVLLVIFNPIQISTLWVMGVALFLSISVFYTWGWYSVLLLFRKMKVPASQRETAMSLIPSAKPYTDNVDTEEDGGDI
ncbi:hypothetical protein HOLleu_25593 [Holothuria leucospilota]|uniref:Uncharacterized protein n=1 Tax=Holothuria leucospilota TaxID=206669 RepID=A0A9Q1BT88_HOLLE|nr:hypothetical protein HOLleu_25593 [Holothuria leucospilota]